MKTNFMDSPDDVFADHSVPEVGRHTGPAILHWFFSNSELYSGAGRTALAGKKVGIRDGMPGTTIHHREHCFAGDGREKDCGRG